MKIRDHLYVTDIIKVPVCLIDDDACNFKVSNIHYVVKEITHLDDVFEAMTKVLPIIIGEFDMVYARVQRPVVCAEFFDLVVQDNVVEILWQVEPPDWVYNQQWIDKNKSLGGTTAFSVLF